jgi:hypothetical protein
MDIKDKNGREISEGDTIRYQDSFGDWEEGNVIDVGAALAIDYFSEPILLYTFAKNGHVDAWNVYDGTPIPELEVVD